MTPLGDPRFCNCCTPGIAPAPAVIWNRPGLSEITYRIGTFGSFRQSMLAEIHRYPELSGLATRESDDHAVTLLELFAALGDVLTFYNERIANEMYLGPALHKASVEQLVALLGYLPRPALSATGALSFEIEEGKSTRIWQGLKVMSIPGPDEVAQIFETLEEIRGAGRLNAAPVFAPFARINPLEEGRTTAPITALAGLGSGDTFVIFGRNAIEEKTLRSLVDEPGGTQARWSPPVQAPGLNPRYVRTAKSLRRLRFFGHNAPASHNIYDPEELPQNRWRNESIDGSISASVGDYALDARIDDLTAGAHLLLDAGPTAEPRLRTARVTATEDRAATLGPLADSVTHVAVRETVIGRPTAVALPDNTPAVLVRTGAGHPAGFEDIETPGQTLYVQGSPPLFASSDVTAVSGAGGRFDMFVRDAAQRLQHRAWAGSWGAWQDLGGLLTSAPCPVATAGGQVRVFVRGPASGLWVFDATGAPQPPEPLGGILASPPAAITPDGVRIAVFARGIDDALWWRLFNGLSWSAWENLGGQIDGTPAVSANGAGRLDVFARGLTGGIRHFRQTAIGWEPPQDLGGDIDGNPAAVGGGPDWAAVITRQPDGSVAFKARVGDTLTDWIPQGGSIVSDPSVTVVPSGVYMTARQVDDTVVTAQLSLTPPVWIRHGGGFGQIPDRRSTRLFEIGTDDVEFRDFDYPDAVEGGWLALPLLAGEDHADPDGLGALKKGRKIIIGGEKLAHRAAVTATFAVPSSLGGRPDHLAVGFTPPLPKTAGPLQLMGNVAEASHGETQREDAIGNGDASVAFQRFPVPPGEITHLPVSTDTRPQPQVSLRVDGVEWQEVASLYGAAPKARSYTLRIPADDDPVLSGGDGLRAGARFPTGALNLRLTRRLGAGLAGNLKAGQLGIPLEKPVGLKAVTNLADTSGGASGETAEDARHAAPDVVRTFGRIVSLRDFEAMATASGLAARAHVTWVWNRMQRTAHLTVAGPDGVALSPENLTLLYDQLTASRDPNRPLMLDNRVRVPIALAAKLLRNPAYEPDAVQAAATAAITQAFAFDRVQMGRPVHLSDAYAVLQGVAGVMAVDVDLLHLKDHTDLTPAERAVRAVTVEPVQAHIRLYPARPTPADPTLIDRYQSAAYLPEPPPPVLPAEMAWIENPATDIILTIVEAL